MTRADVEALVEHYRSVAPDGLRLVLEYDGDDHEVAYVRDDVEASYSPEEFQEKVKQLVVEGLGEAPEQGEFRLFGDLGAVVRVFDNAVVVHLPVDEFSGVAATFDVGRTPSLDELVATGTETVEQG